MRLSLPALLFAALLGASPVLAASSPDFSKSPDFPKSPDYPKSLAQMAAHKAVYKLSLDSAASKDSVVGGTGTMNYEVIDTCDGWASQQRLIMDITNSDGQLIHMVSDYSTWEAKDGSRLRFRVLQTTDTAVTMQLAGEADFQPGGRGGVVHYTDPKPHEMKLAPGTLFPMAHTAHIMALAQSGQKFITLPLFDGSSDTGPEDTFIVVTGALAPMPFRYQSLSPLPSNQVNVSFYDHASGSEQPDYEVAMRYWTNGVADDLKMNFGDFTMDGTLTDFRPAAHPC